MANDKIKKSDLIGNINLKSEIKSLEAMLVAVEKLDEGVKKMAKNKLEDVVKIDVTSVKGLKSLNEAKKEAQAIDAQAIAQAKQKKAIEAQLTKKKKELTAEEIRGNQEKRKSKQLREAEVVIASKEAGTIERLEAMNKKLRIQKKKLNLETEKGRKLNERYNKRIEENTKKIKANADATVKQKMNIGNYANSVQQGINSTGLLSNQMLILSRVQAILTLGTKAYNAMLARMSATTTGATASTITFTGVLKLLRGGISKATSAVWRFTASLLANPIGAIAVGVTALIAGISALVGAFLSTQKGADALNRVLRPVKELFFTFVGFIQDKAIAVFEFLGRAIEDPIGALKELGGFVLDNIINRFKAFGVFAEGVAKILKGDLSEGLKQVANAGIQLTTGFTEVASSISDASAEALARGKEIAELAIAEEKAKLRLTTIIAEQRKEYQKLKALGNDQSLTDRERITAMEEAKELQKDIAKNETEALRLRLKRMILETKANDTSREELQEIEDLKKEIAQKEEASLKKIAGITSLQSGIEKRIFERKRKFIVETAKLQGDIDKEINSNAIENMENELERLKEKGLISISAEEEMLEEINKLKEKNLEISRREELKSAKAKYLNDKRLAEGNAEELRLIEANYAKKKELINVKYNDKKVDLVEQTNEKIMDSEEELAQKLNELFDKSRDEKNRAKALELQEKLNEDQEELERIKKQGNLRLTEELKQMDKIAEAKKAKRDQQFQEEYESLTAQYKQDLKDAGDNAEAKEKIEETYQNAILNIAKERDMEVDEIEAENLKTKEALIKAEQKQMIEATEKLLETQLNALNTMMDKRKDSLNSELSDSKKQEDRLQALADQRVLGAEESLSAEKEAQAEIQKELRKAERNKKLLALSMTTLDLVSSYAKKGIDNPTSKAQKDLVGLLSRIQGVQQFAEGTESVEGGVKGKDSVPALLMPEERVFTVEQNKRIGNISNDEASHILEAHRKGAFSSDVTPIIAGVKTVNNDDLARKVSKPIIDAIKNIPVASVDHHALADYITNTIRTQNTIERRHYKGNQIFK